MIGKRIRVSVLMGVALCITTVLYGQSFFFSNLSTRDGLPSNVVATVAQDTHNYIWIGTDNGLARYDGYVFKTFRSADNPHSLPENGICTLLADGDSLWVGTWKGLCRINTRNFQISRITQVGNAAIRSLYKDKKGNVWIGTLNGLWQYSPDKKFKAYTVENSKLSHNTVRSMYEDAHGTLWVGTYDKLNRFDAIKGEFLAIDLKGNYKPELKNNLIVDIKPVKDADSLLWVGTETGLCLFNTQTLRYTHFAGKSSGFSNEVIKHIYTGPDGLLWLGTDFGLNLFDPKTKKNTIYFHNPRVSYSIANNVIWQIFEDSGGTIWLITANGISKANKDNQNLRYHDVTYEYDHQAIGNQVKSILVSKKGIVWIATIHGVIRMDPKTGTQKIFDIESKAADRIIFNNVFTLEEDDLGRIWIGTAGGINVWDDEKQTMHAISANAENGLSSNYIARFIKGPDGSFWISAWEGGLFKMVSGFEKLDKIKFEYVADFGTEKIIYAVNALWSIRNHELYRIDLNAYVPKKIETFSKAARGQNINNLYYAPKGSIWAGALNGLIEYRLDTDSARFHPIITGSDVVLNNFISDPSGNIWAATDKYILKYNPQNATPEIFPLDKGLPLKMFYAGCVARSKDNELLFGGDNGFVSFTTDIKPNTYEPDVFITSIEINNKPIQPFQELNNHTTLTEDVSFTPALTLDYSQRSVTFSFASLHYWQPDINVFAYMLEGLDTEWTYASGTKNFAVYSNLSPGTYRLRIRATNNYGIWSPKEATVQVVVRPPLFLSPGFIVAYALMAILVTIVAFRIYGVRLKLKNEVKIARLEKEHAEEIVQAKQEFFTSISHELRTPITLIIPPIQQILKRNNLDEEDKTLITIAEKNSQRLLRLINQFLDFRRIEHGNQSLKLSWFDLVPFCQELYNLFTDKAARSEIDFIFTPRVDACPIWADKEKVEIIVFNLFSNAFKFTPRNGRIEFIIDVERDASDKGSVRLTVADSGVGIAPEEHAKIFEQFYQTNDARKMEGGSGIGLTLVSEYTKLHRGETKLTSEPGAGSTFTITLPLGNDHFPVDQQDEGREVNVLATRAANSPGDSYEFNLRSNKPLILLVEDNVDITDLIQVSLKNKYCFVTAENGEDGLHKAHTLLPEIIISDIMMPVMDGLEFCRRIKHDNKTSHIPIIVLTAKSLVSQRIEGIRMGADIYLTKPFEIELLEAHIDHLLERKKELAQFFKNELITEPKMNQGAENEDDRFLKKVMNVIEANIASPDFNVEMIGEEIGMSTSQLYRKLKSLTHLGANEIIKKYRIKKASLLLKNKEGNISEIMYEVGFSNLSYFSKCFRAEFGLTPKEYQQRESKPSYDLPQNLETGYSSKHANMEEGTPINE